MTVLRNWAPFSIETASSSTWPRTAIHATQTPGLPEGLKSALVTWSGMVVSSTVPVGMVELWSVIVCVAGSSTVCIDSGKKNDPGVVSVAFCAAARMVASTPGSPWSLNFATSLFASSVRTGPQSVTVCTSLEYDVDQVRASRYSNVVPVCRNTATRNGA